MKVIVLFIALTGLMSLFGCGNKVNFDGSAKDQSSLGEVPTIIPSQPNPEVPDINPPVIDDPPIVLDPVPVEPEPELPPPDVPSPSPVITPEPPVVVTPPPPPPTPLKLKAGTCAVGNSEIILSCLNCESEAPILPPPLLSKKAQELLDIMTASCSIHNDSDPRGLVPATHDELLKRLIQCSPTLYPDSNFVNTQAWTIDRLLNNRQAQLAAFSGLYYTSVTRDFETYFGIDVGEARYTFCRREPSFNSGAIYPIEYYQQDHGPIYNMPPLYATANRYRNQLRNCLAESLRNPNPQQTPTIPGIDCSYESAEGDMSQLVVEKVNAWQDQGHTVYFEGFNQCGVMDRPEQFLDRSEPIKLAIKKCHQQ
jgi:hypothetical protein